MKGFPPRTVSKEALLVDGDDAAFRRTVDNLVDFAARLQQIREAIARQMQVSPPQYRILMALAHNTTGEPLSIGDLADRLGVSVPFAVNETRALAKAGLIEKRSATVDRRKVDLVLSAEGMAAVVKAGPAQRDVNDMLFGTLDKRKFEALGKLVKNMLESSDAALALAKLGAP
jgi:DNA-binding MarR family transcriptional regulator